jgi:hypothetical protein
MVSRKADSPGLRADQRDILHATLQYELHLPRLGIVRPHQWVLSIPAHQDPLLCSPARPITWWWLIRDLEPGDILERSCIRVLLARDPGQGRDRRQGGLCLRRRVRRRRRLSSRRLGLCIVLHCVQGSLPRALLFINFDPFYYLCLILLDFGHPFPYSGVDGRMDDRLIQVDNQGQPSCREQRILGKVLEPMGFL